VPSDSRWRFIVFQIFRHVGIQGVIDQFNNELCEGVGQRAVTRLTGTDRKTVARLALRVGRGCAELHDRLMVGIRVNRETAPARTGTEAACGRNSRVDVYQPRFLHSGERNQIANSRIVPAPYRLISSPLRKPESPS
jgi:hypothetical protein